MHAKITNILLSLNRFALFKNKSDLILILLGEWIFENDCILTG